MAACLGLAACGGGGGGGDTSASSASASTPPLGVVKVQVTDSFGSAVAGATVQGPMGSASSDAKGEALVILATPEASAAVTVSNASFVGQSVVATGASDRVNVVALTLERVSSAAGGSIASRSGSLPQISADGQSLSFEVELVVVDGDAQPIQTLGAADFALRVCVPDPTDTRTHCVRGAAADVGYQPASATPEAMAQIPGLPARPYATALLLDQSGSILASDATGARLYSTKAFLSALGSDDRALLAAFASGPAALITSAPLTVYGAFRDRAAAPGYFSTLDGLAQQLGGATPLYDSLDSVRRQIVADPTLPTDMARAVVVFTDGADTNCVSPADCRARREQSIAGAQADGVRLFTIALGSSVDLLALGELANQTGGAMLYADTVEQLLPLYGSVGRLHSLSLPTYRLRWTVRAAAPGAFRPGYTLLGRVQVNTRQSSFDVPFVVGVP